MIVKDITDLIEGVANLSFQESYDNSGLIVGDYFAEINGILLCLDVTEKIIDEAIQHNCNLIVSHHPIVFKGLKKINGSNFIERVIIKSIKNNINIYSAHTNLDNVLKNGVNEKIASKLNLLNIEILKPIKGNLAKLITYCPPQYSDELKEQLWAANSGNIGNYDKCSFSTLGTGTFRGNESSNPTIGSVGELEKVEENKIEVLFEKQNQSQILKVLKEKHPYEEVAYEVYDISNENQTKGAGVVGSLSEPMNKLFFLNYIKEKMNLSVIKYTNNKDEVIQKVAVCGGSGRFLLDNAIRSGAQAFITSDFKYHDYFDAEDKIMVCDIGHNESEIFTLEIFNKIIQDKFPNFAPRFAETNTNPINYYF